MNKLELVSPAGSKDQLIAAVNAGADAVYLAYEKYGARAYAENFDLKSLESAVSLAHQENVKIYLALNTLIKENELAGLIDFIFNAFKKISFDGVILQDFAVKKILNAIFPDIPVHASTQLNIHNSSSLEYLKNNSFKRVVLAREMTLDEIREVSLKKIIDIEIFGHGSQCYSYSGQCYLSSFVGERSGNRGTCPQPCRMKFKIIDSKESGGEDINSKARDSNKITGDNYFFSKSDLMTIFYLPEIINAGVRALKLEGRMKTPEYVAVITKIYRKYIDLCYDSTCDYKVDKDDIYKLTQIFSREINEGYLKKEFPENIISLKKSGSVGSVFGRIIRIENGRTGKKSSLDIHIRSGLGLSRGDVLEIWTKKGNTRIEADSFDSYPDNNGDKKIYRITVQNSPALNINDRVFKYFDYELDREAKSICMPLDHVKKEAAGAKADILINLDNYYKLKSLAKKSSSQKDINSALYTAASRDKKSRTIHFNGDAGIKKSSITLFLYNDASKSPGILRNIARIISANREKYGNEFININICYEDSESLFKDNNENELKKILEIYELFKEINVSFYLSTPNIAYDRELMILEKFLGMFINSGMCNFYVSNPGVLQLLCRLSGPAGFPVNAIIGYNMNIFNSFALKNITEYAGNRIAIKEIILSPELTLQETNELIENINRDDNFEKLFSGTDFSVYSYGFFPVMTSRVRYKNLVNRKEEYMEDFSLSDRKNFSFRLSRDYLRNTQVFNSKKHCLLFDLKEMIQKGITGFLADSRFLEEEEIYSVLKYFIEGLVIAGNLCRARHNEYSPGNVYEKKYEAFTAKLSKSPYISDYTKGHLYRPVI